MAFANTSAKLDGNGSDNTWFIFPLVCSLAQALISEALNGKLNTCAEEESLLRYDFLIG